MTTCVSTKPAKTAAWMRNEHRIIAGLIANLSAHIAAVPSIGRDEWLSTLVQLVTRFRAHMRGHMKAEEADDGFLTPVLQRRPTLSREVDHLLHEHRELLSLLDQVAEEVAGLCAEDVLLIEDACHRLQHLLSAIRHHEEHEELLVTFVFSQDIGTED
ncbi:MAG: hypothetical protein HOP29_04350 [Phycisphaerales bacterium]|nr:hypothetical protein [Phycisphaerales bacterium]